MLFAALSQQSLFNCCRRPVGGLLFIFSRRAFAQTPDNIAEREVHRRQAAIPEGEAALARGKSALKAKNYTVAYQEFKTAIGYLPDAVVSGKAHDQAAEGVCKSGTVLAEARIAEGDYAGAEAILSEILNRYDPNCRKAQELFAHLRTARLLQQNSRCRLHQQSRGSETPPRRSRRLLSVRPVRSRR